MMCTFCRIRRHLDHVQDRHPDDWAALVGTLRKLADWVEAAHPPAPPPAPALEAADAPLAIAELEILTGDFLAQRLYRAAAAIDRPSAGWLNGSCTAALQGNTLRLSVRYALHTEKLDGEIRPVVERAAADLFGRTVRVVVEHVA